MASKPAEEATEKPLKYQTWVLKVSIHCEGCKRKVKKVLQSIEGVYTTEIDSHLHKVTVTGNVAAETLIRRLVKTGKHAEMWPEKVEKKGEVKIKENETNPNLTSDEKKKKPQEKPEGEVVVTETKSKKKNVEAAETEQPMKTNEAASTQAKSVDENQKNGGKSEAKKPENATTKSVETPPLVKEEEGNVGEAEKSGNGGGGNGNGNGNGGGSGKKKGKKGQKCNLGGVASSENGGGSSTLPSTATATATATATTHVGPMNFHHPHQHEYPYSQPYGPSPVYAVSYNTTYPTSSYGGSYYAPPYMYTYMDNETRAPYMYVDPEIRAPRSSDSFEMFSEENANGCSIM